MKKIVKIPIITVIISLFIYALTICVSANEPMHYGFNFDHPSKFIEFIDASFGKSEEYNAYMDEEFFSFSQTKAQNMASNLIKYGVLFPKNEAETRDFYGIYTVSALDGKGDLTVSYTIEDAKYLITYNYDRLVEYTLPDEYATSFDLGDSKVDLYRMFNSITNEDELRGVCQIENTTVYVRITGNVNECSFDWFDYKKGDGLYTNDGTQFPDTSAPDANSTQITTEVESDSEENKNSDSDDCTGCGGFSAFAGFIALVCAAGAVVLVKKK